LAGLDEIAFVDADLADALAELGGQVNLGGSMRPLPLANPSPRPSVRSSDLASRPMTTNSTSTNNTRRSAFWLGFSWPFLFR